MAAKNEVMRALQSMPETISFADIKETIAIIEANRCAMDSISAGKVYTGEEVKEYVRRMVGHND